MDDTEKQIEIQKLYQSDNYLIVNKPYDMYINSDEPGQKNTLIRHLALPDSHLKSSAEPLLFVHRLDFATSGVICLARSRRAAAAAGRCFERRTTRKYYLAVVRGHVAVDRADFEYDVGEDTSIRDGSNRMRAVACDGDAARCARARSARTRLLALKRGSYCGDPVTVILMKPYTGRRHQLRVHCAAVSHPILGDYTYSGRRDVKPHRMFLHAIRLVIPLQDEPLDVETGEEFFSDIQFASQWSSSELLHDFRTECQRRLLYEIIDSVDFSCGSYKCYGRA